MISQNLSILIAEDDEDDMFIIERSFLNNPNFSKVNLVRNGQEMLDFLQESDELPDVILTDINMPVLDGISAIEKMCEDERLQAIPTFFYSTAINPAYQIKCENLGTKGYLVKPMKIEDFDLIPIQIFSKISES
ncbi:response regulator [Flavobacterium sp.]|uniref:response regulator n=1 Tax=Flavobacterium sp. TaxID=239 RepID=UPI00121C5F0B|nr:response regulator [Flavobacterium sp.]RZJ69265.1 MAG: response regulator [Flavobacterium sp.]